MNRGEAIETERLLLQPWKEADHPGLFEMLSDPLTMAAWPSPFDLEQFHNWVVSAARVDETRVPGRLAVICKEDGALVGTVALMRLDVAGVIENDLGYIIHHPYWRCGFGHEAARGLMESGHERFGLKRIIASMADDNHASIAVAKKLQMKFESSFQNIRNRNKTHLIFASLVN